MKRKGELSAAWEACTPSGRSTVYTKCVSPIPQRLTLPHLPPLKCDAGNGEGRGGCHALQRTPGGDDGVLLRECVEEWRVV